MTTAEIVNGNLVITIPMGAPTLSASGKNLVVASTWGIIVTTCVVNGKPVKIGANAFIDK